MIKPLIQDLEAERSNLTNLINADNATIAELRRVHLNVFYDRVRNMENRKELVVNALSALRNVCKHDWDTGKYKDRERIFTCTICGEQREG